MNGQEMIVLIVLIVIMGRVISAKYGVNAWGKRGRRDRVQPAGQQCRRLKQPE